MGRDLRKFGDRELRAVGQNDGAKHGVLQLTHVAGPGVAGQQLERFLAYTVDAPTLFGGEPRQEMQRQLGHILEPVAHRRHPDREDVQPVVEVLAEPAVLDELDHVAVGRRDQAEIDLHRLLGADRIDLALLQGPQQLDLRVERQFADLVEEERTAVGFLELADALVDSASERASLMAEQDALDQVLRDGAAVDGDERPRLAFALALDGARDQLLADAAFALDEHRDVGAGGTVSKRDDTLHGLPANDEVAEGERPFRLLLDAGDLSLQRLDLERAVDRHLEALGRSRLDDEVRRTGAHGRDGGVDRAMGGVPSFGARRFNTSMPSMPGMTWSSRTSAMAPRSGPSRICRACSPPWAVLVS